MEYVGGDSLRPCFRCAHRGDQRPDHNSNQGQPAHYHPGHDEHSQLSDVGHFGGIPSRVVSGQVPFHRPGIRARNSILGARHVRSRRARRYFSAKRARFAPPVLCRKQRAGRDAVGNSDPSRPLLGIRIRRPHGRTCGRDRDIEAEFRIPPRRGGHGRQGFSRRLRFLQSLFSR